MSAWSIRVNNSRFEPLGEFVNLQSFKVDGALNKVRTFQMKMDMANVLAPTLAINATFEPLYFEAVREGTLLFHGPLMSLLESGEGEDATLSVNAAGPEIIFTKRLVATATSAEQKEGLRLAAGTERALRFKELLAASNARTVGAVAGSGETHIDYITGPIKSTANGAYESQSFRTLAEVLTDMYLQAEGFDWYVSPQRAEALKIGRLIIEDVIGKTQANSVFEWGEGTRGNVAKFSRTVDLSNLITQGWNLSSAGPEATGAPTVKKLDEEAAAKWGLSEAMVPLSALNLSMREAITLEALTYRKKPRQTISFEPAVDDGTGKVPQFERDFGLGDSLPLRVKYGGAEHVNALMRCWGASFSMDQNGKETQSILTAEE